MRTLDYLIDFPDLYLPPVVAAAGIAVLCAALSALVVLRRLAFVGQGVSHAAFGGVGIALALGLFSPVFAHEWARLAVVVVFCLGTGLWIAWAGERRAPDGSVRTDRSDTAIGVALAVSMAVGFVLHRHVAQAAGASGGVAPPALESVLFGSVVEVGWLDAVAAWVLALVAVGALWWWRRPMLFWAFDPQGARSFGVATGRMRIVLMVLLTLAVVMTTRVAGVVLATALLVLPGAIALRLSRRLEVVVALSAAVAVVGTLGGLVVSFETDLQPGPTVVLTLAAFALAAWAVGLLKKTEGRHEG